MYGRVKALSEVAVLAHAIATSEASKPSNESMGLAWAVCVQCLTPLDLFSRKRRRGGLNPKDKVDTSSILGISQEREPCP